MSEEKAPKRTKAADETFCPSCGEPIKAEAVLCPNCGVPALSYRGGAAWDPVKAKSKTTAVLLAVFLGFWTWCYTYKRDAWKFWVNLGFTVITLGAYYVIAWIWAIIDVSIKPEDYYRNYPGKQQDVGVGAQINAHAPPPPSSQGPKTATAPLPPLPRKGVQYFIDRSGSRMGPYSLEETKLFFEQGLLVESDLARSEKMADWLPLRAVLLKALRPPSFMGGAIFVTFFFFPLGIIAIVFASLVDSKFNSGDYDGALRASKNAETFCIAGLLTPIFALIVVGVLCAVFRVQ